MIAVLAWFTVSPPSYRFILGPLFLTFMIPLAFVLHSIRMSWVKPVLVGGLAVVLGTVTLFTAVDRVDYSAMSTEVTWATLDSIFVRAVTAVRDTGVCD